MKKLIGLLACIMLLGLSTVFAQSMTVTGTVTSESGEVLPGVSVSIKGTTQGTNTDVSGKYSINVKTGDILEFSFTGMVTQFIKVKNQKVINVTLKDDRVMTDDVIVVAYGTAKKSSFTGAATSVKGDRIAAAKAESIDKALAGKISGVRVASTTGAPGSSGEIQIRGIGSITGSTSPLYVVDGVALTNGAYGHSGQSQSILSTINPDDIESTTVLKDAAAASLYGSRAANGVVIITTKKGRSGKTRFNFKANYGFSNLATKSFETMSGEAFYDYTKASYINYQLNRENKLFNYTQADYDRVKKQIEDEKWVEFKRQNGGNWRDEVYGTGTDSEVQFSVSGGNDKTKYFTSLGYKDVQGIVENTSFQRYTGLLNINTKAKEWLKLSFKTQLAYTDLKGSRDQSDQQQGLGTTSPVSLLFSMNPAEPVYNKDGSLNMNAGLGKVKNLKTILKAEDEYIKTKTYRALSSFKADFDIYKGIAFSTTNSVDYVNVNAFEYWGPNSINGASMNALGNRAERRVITTSSSNVLRYNGVFDDIHNISAIAGYEVQDYEFLYVNTTAKDYSTDKLDELAVGKPDNASSYKYRNFLRSFFGNINYNYDNKYYAAFSVRSDESSKLGEDNRQGIFWSASASWRFSKEEFMQNDFIQDGKIRVSYGTNGTLPGGSYGSLNLYDFSAIYGDKSAIYLYQPENKDLGWEMSSNFNVGLDLTFLDKFSFTIEYFYKYTKDLLLNVPTSYIAGFPSVIQNFGEISNKGIDMEIHVNDILSSDFKWNIDLAMSTLSAKVEKLPGGKDIILGDGNLYVYSEGEDLYSFYVAKWAGVNNDTGLSQFYIDPTKPATPSNLTYKYSEAKRGNMGKAFPDFSGGLSNTFSYKGFTLDILTTFQFGGNLFDYPGYFFHHEGVRGTFNLAKDVEGNYWTPTNKDAKYPRPVYGWGNRPDKWSTKNIMSTDYIRLKELGLSYNIPKNIYKSWGIDNVKLNFHVSNLAYLYAATDDMELEVNLNGYRTVDTPLARTFSFGVTLDF
jgi:TonB-linked SusC/RagA family outer membrane protein